MDSRLDSLDPSSDRYKVLSSARTFKAAWVALGESLTLVREKGTFREWGYSTFETYCRRELRIKQDTANKLTRSFSFLRDHEPKLLEERETREMPPLDVVDLLSQARERTKLSDNEFEKVRDEALSTPAEGKKAPTKNQVMKRLREHDPEAFKPAPKPEAAVGENDLRKALLLAERLESLLQAQGDGVSKDAVRSAGSVVFELRERFAQTRRQGAA